MQLAIIKKKNRNIPLFFLIKVAYIIKISYIFTLDENSSTSILANISEKLIIF